MREGRWVGQGVLAELKVTELGSTAIGAAVERARYRFKISNASIWDAFSRLDWVRHRPARQHLAPACRLRSGTSVRRCRPVHRRWRSNGHNGRVGAMIGWRDHDKPSQYGRRYRVCRRVSLTFGGADAGWAGFRTTVRGRMRSRRERSKEMGTGGLTAEFASFWLRAIDHGGVPS